MQKKSFSINSKWSYIDKLAKLPRPLHGRPSLPASIAILEALSKNCNHQTPQNEKKYVFGKWQIKICLLITPILSIEWCYMSYILYFASLYMIFTCCQLTLGPFSSILKRSAVGRHSNCRQAKPDMSSARRKHAGRSYCACVVQLSVTQRWRHMTSQWRRYLFI